MNLLLIILVVLGLLVVLAFTVALRVIFTFNSERPDMNLTLLWLYPLLKAVITTEENKRILTVFLFNKSIMRKELKPGKGKTKANNMEVIRNVNPTDVNVNAEYGFRDPFVTGVACGAINIAAQFININSLNQKPDFVADNDYIHLDATAKVNLGTALLNLYKARSKNQNK